MDADRLARLAELSEADLAEYVLSNERLRMVVANQDPRVQLMERLYGDPESMKDIHRHSKRLFPKARVPEVDIPAETTAAVKAALKDDIDSIKDLRKTLETEKQTRERSSFRAKLEEAGAEAGDLDAIEQFMVDNEFGPKAMEAAVAAFYRSKEPAEPTSTGFDWEDPGAEHMKALLSAAPGADLDKINEPWVRKIWQESMGAPRGRR